MDEPVHRPGLDRIVATVALQVFRETLHAGVALGRIGLNRFGYNGLQIAAAGAALPGEPYHARCADS